MKITGIKEELALQRAFFDTGQTLDPSFRVAQLKHLKSCICAYEKEINEALRKDLNKAPFESYMTEVGLVLSEISYLLKRIKSWVRPKRVRMSLASFPGRAYLYPEPYGVALLMSPWNYPFMLSVMPLVGAMAAGNCAILKPSAYSAHTSAVLVKMLGEGFPKEYLDVAEGGREANQALLQEKFDYIFFTGSVTVGKTVMSAAAKHLTPVTLELGGKSPCIVDADANLDLAAKRIVWGKFLNAGQTCVAPDYLLAHKGIKDKLLDKLCQCIDSFYGKDPLQHSDLPKIINEKHFERLLSYLASGKVLHGGSHDRQRQLIAPTLVTGVQWEDPIMQEEIFGPILPVLQIEDLEEGIRLINARPKPLACYYFTGSKAKEQELIRRVSFGGGCINDTVLHVASAHLPFGGVGQSGMGSYHGKASFDTFSHYKSLIKQSTGLDVPLRYHPYGKKLNLLKRVLK